MKRRDFLSFQTQLLGALTAAFAIPGRLLNAGPRFKDAPQFIRVAVITGGKGGRRFTVREFYELRRGDLCAIFPFEYGDDGRKAIYRCQQDAYPVKGEPGNYATIVDLDHYE